MGWTGRQGNVWRRRLGILAALTSITAGLIQIALFLGYPPPPSDQLPGRVGSEPKTDTQPERPDVRKRGPGRCTPYHYWHSGRCKDARIEVQRSHVVDTLIGK